MSANKMSERAQQIANGKKGRGIYTLCKQPLPVYCTPIAIYFLLYFLRGRERVVMRTCGRVSMTIKDNVLATQQKLFYVYIYVFIIFSIWRKYGFFFVLLRWIAICENWHYVCMLVVSPRCSFLSSLQRSPPDYYKLFFNFDKYTPNTKTK